MAAVMAVGLVVTANWLGRLVPAAGLAAIHVEPTTSPAPDPQDWAKPGATAVVNRVDSTVRAGSIVLPHDGGGDRSGTLTACRTIIPYLRGRYGLVPLPGPDV